MLDILLMQVSLTVLGHCDKCITRSQQKQASNKQRSIFDSMKRSSNVKQKPSSKKRKVVEDSAIKISSDYDMNADSDESNNIQAFLMRYFFVLSCGF